jgi:glycosyltransferase involved in cell wall biosynthesis
MLRIGIIATHPIQYQVPWFVELAKHKQIDLTVYYALIPDQTEQGVGFGVPFTWDIPLLEGYTWKLLPNRNDSPSLRGFFKSSTPAVYEALAISKPHIVIITGWQSLPLMQALWACIRLGIPRIIRAESNALRMRRWWIRMLHRILLSQYNSFLSIGKANAGFYLGYGISPDRIFPCHYFVDNRRFQEQSDHIRSERKNIRSEWGIGTNTVCFLYAGKLEPKKRIMDLLQAFAIAAKIACNMHLLVVGTGALMEEAKRFTCEKKLSVSFAGFLNQSEIARAYVAGDCLVLPSDFGETWGLVVNEAMACGRPAIVSDRVGCAPDLIINGETGYIFPFGDIHALSVLLVQLSSTGERLGTMGEKARQHIAHYSVEKATEGTLQAIDYVLDRKA